MSALPATDRPDSPAALFARQGYAVVEGLVTPARVAMVRDHLNDRMREGTLREGDTLVPGTPCTHGDSLLDWLLGCLKPDVENLTGLRLDPTYSYARIYKHGDTLKPHRDRPACEISLSLNLDQEPAEPWPLMIADGFAALLHPGDALLYRGVAHTHWREPFAGERATQVFLHYVDRDGPHAAEKFDSRSAFAVPKPTQATN